MKKRTKSLEGVPWRQSLKSGQVLKDATRLAGAVLRTKAETKLKKAALNTLIWNVTVSDGKHDTRYCSKTAMKEASERIHEHVFERAKLIKLILKNPKKVAAYFKLAVSCVVTVDEDTLLMEKSSKLSGWERYKVAGIEVIDRQTGKLVDFDELQKPISLVMNNE